MADTERFLPRAAEARRESKYVEFKERFDPGNDGEWLELLKDLVAIANVGGGVIVIGLRNDGSLSREDVQAVLALDGATICDKLTSYLGADFDDFEIGAVTRNGGRVAAIVIGPVEEAPLTFVRPGTYPDPRRPDRQKSAFGRGPYFRHGARSEPATRDDLRQFIERRLEAVRQEWLGGIQRVMTAPEGSEIVAIQRSENEQGDRAIRITTDDSAPLYRAVDWDVTHPYRQTELVPRVSERLPEGVTFNSHDLLSVRRAHNIDEHTRPDFVHRVRAGNSDSSLTELDLERSSAARGHEARSRSVRVAGALRSELILVQQSAEPVAAAETIERQRFTDRVRAGNSDLRPLPSLLSSATSEASAVSASAASRRLPRQPLVRGRERRPRSRRVARLATQPVRTRATVRRGGRGGGDDRVAAVH